MANAALFLAVLKDRRDLPTRSTPPTRSTEMAYFIADAEPALVVVAAESRDAIAEIAAEHTA